MELADAPVDQMPQIAPIHEQNLLQPHPRRGASHAPSSNCIRRIVNHKIRFQILVGIVQKPSFVVPLHLGTIDAPNRQVVWLLSCP